MRMGTYGNGKLPAIDLKRTGQNIMKMRKEAGVTVRELQVMFGFTSPQAIYNWQNGISLPSVDNFIVLAAVLGTTIEEIIAIEGEDSDGDEETTICPQILS